MKRTYIHPITEAHECRPAGLICQSLMQSTRPADLNREILSRRGHYYTDDWEDDFIYEDD